MGKKLLILLNNLLIIWDRLFFWIASTLFSSQFAHPISPEAETRNRDTCTSTGTMLTQVQSSLPEAFNFRRYPKYRTQPVCEPYRSQCVWCRLKKKKSRVHSESTCNKEKNNPALLFIPCGLTNLSVTLQESREFPFSKHDNKQALMDVTIFGSVSIKSTFRKLWKGLIHNRDTVWEEITSVNVCLFFVFHRELDGGGAKTFADSTAPTSACATRRPAAAPRWAAGTCRPTKLISPSSRRRTMCQAAAGGSPVTTGRSLQMQPLRRQNSSCGSDGTTRRSSVPLQALPGLKTLLC